MQNIPDSPDFPLDLYLKPQTLIGISGLDNRNNAIHKSIWEIFTGNKGSDSAPVLYKLIDNAYEFPVVKPKRNSYEWYIPKGILKKNWMDKHLNKIPALIAVFYDLDWNDPMWNEKMIECSSRVQSMRVALEGRETKLCVVLIQNKSVIPSNEDPLTTERAAALCASCQLTIKSLFVLPHGDHLQGYSTRLDSAFNELAQLYYHNEIKNIKSHREHLNKNTHQYLFVRHQFKMAFLSEMKQDIHTAYKHYTHAYNNLLDIRVVDTNAMEIRTVSGFINFKMCRLMFALNLPRDAISQFKTHTERFKARLGFQELSFEHYAWLSKQFNIFGDIFDEAVKQGLPAVQTQHPGIYYQQAVQYALLRQKASLELCTSVGEYPIPDPLQGFSRMEFYGQRPWRLGKVGGEPPDPQIELNGIKALQYFEKQVNHTNIIIALYGLAVAQYKTYKCPRTRRFLVVQMAEQYYKSEDYGKALTLLTHMLWDYRSERWWLLLSDILEKALRCAFLTARVDDYIQLSLELLAHQMHVDPIQRAFIYENLKRVLSAQRPLPDTSTPQNTNVIDLWNNVFENKTELLTLDMSNVISCIDVKAKFLSTKYHANEFVSLEIYVKNFSNFTFDFTKIQVCIINPLSNLVCLVNKDTELSFCFHGGNVKKFLVQFKPSPRDINKELQVRSISLYLGNLQNRSTELTFSGCGNNNDQIPIELSHFRTCPKSVIDFDNIRPLIITTVLPQPSKLDITFIHDKPALLGEWYSIKVNILNRNDFTINKLKVEVSLIDDDGEEMTEFSRVVEKIPEKLPIINEITNLNSNQETELIFYMRAHKVGERNVYVKGSFVLYVQEDIFTFTEETVHISVVKPFDITTRFLSSLFIDVNKLYSGEEFIIMPVVNCQSPWPLIIENTNLEYCPQVKNMDEKVKSQIRGMQLMNGESGTEMFLGCCDKRSENSTIIGQYTVHWRRLGGEIATSQLSITGPPVDWLPLEVKMSCPAHGLVRTPMLVQYHLINKSHHLIQINVSIESSEAFMFAGYKTLQTSILAKSSKSLKYNLYPLIAGSVLLPRLSLSVPENSIDGPALRQEQLSSLLLRTLPTHLFVMPQVKGNPNIPDIIKNANILQV